MYIWYILTEAATSRCRRNGVSGDKQTDSLREKNVWPKRRRLNISFFFLSSLVVSWVVHCRWVGGGSRGESNSKMIPCQSMCKRGQMGWLVPATAAFGLVRSLSAFNLGKPEKTVRKTIRLTEGN